MSMKLLVFGMLMTASYSSFAAKTVIYIQDLLNKNPSSVNTLINAAKKRNVILEWEGYVTPLFNKEVKNPNPPAGHVEFVIEEVKFYGHKNGGWKGYEFQKYVLKDAKTYKQVAESKILRTTYQGGCRPNGMCEQVMSNDKDLGTSRTTALIELIEQADALHKN